MYCDINFKTKKALKEAVKSGQKIRVYTPGLGTPPVNGECAIEGMWYPKPHTWYAIVTLRNGIIIKVV